MRIFNKDICDISHDTHVYTHIQKLCISYETHTLTIYRKL